MQYTFVSLESGCAFKAGLDAAIIAQREAKAEATFCRPPADNTLRMR